MEKNRPVYAVVIGSIRLAIWENAVAPAEGKAQDSPNSPKKVRHAITIVKRYKDNGGAYKETNYLSGLGDLAQAGTAVWMGIEWLRRRQDELQTEDDSAE